MNMDEWEEDIAEPAPDPSNEVGSERWKKTAYEAILRDITSEFENTRFNAVSLIEHFEGDPRLQPLLAGLLSSDQEHLLVTALMGIGEWRHSEGAGMVIDFLTDANRREKITEQVEEEAILSLGHVGGSESLDFLGNYAVQRFKDHEEEEDSRGMAAVEGIAQIAMRGDASAVRFLIDKAGHAAWNMRETCADALGMVFRGKEAIPKLVYDTLITLTKDPNRDVQIAAYLSLDDIVGLDEVNKKILKEARHKQIFGNS